MTYTYEMQDAAGRHVHGGHVERRTLTEAAEAVQGFYADATMLAIGGTLPRLMGFAMALEGERYTVWIEPEMIAARRRRAAA